jgi:hypothetical protein
MLKDHVEKAGLVFEEVSLLNRHQASRFLQVLRRTLFVDSQLQSAHFSFFLLTVYYAQLLKALAYRYSVAFTPVFGKAVRYRPDC